jgi:FkbM family methyltransferase
MPGSENYSFTVKEIKATFSTQSVDAEFGVPWTCRRERLFLEDVVDELNDGDVFWDIGANLGVFSCFAARKLSTGHVTAFEPYPPNVAQLQSNLSRNAAAEMYSVCSMALHNTMGTVGFKSPTPPTPGMQTGTIDPDAESIRVGCVDGDSLVEDGCVPHPTVVKLDVEGAEPFVLDGMEQTLRQRQCRSLYCEIHLPKDHGTRPAVQDYGETPEEVRERIHSFGFNVEYERERKSELHIKATK